jgi:hypothetical protein
MCWGIHPNKPPPESTTMSSIYDPIKVNLPEGFAIPVNPGLHGDMQFFELGGTHYTVCRPYYDEHKVHYFYQAHDSDEGLVTISYVNIDENNAETAGPDDSWDVEISTGSDVWGLERTTQAVADAVKLHSALGRAAQYQR